MTCSQVAGQPHSSWPARLQHLVCGQVSSILVKHDGCYNPQVLVTDFRDSYKVALAIAQMDCVRVPVQTIQEWAAGKKYILVSFFHSAQHFCSLASYSTESRSVWQCAVNWEGETGNKAIITLTRHWK